MIEFMNKRLSNPLIASSCITTESAPKVLKLVEFGMQGAILKSCADYERRSVSGKRQFAVSSDGYTYASSSFEKEILTLEETLNMMKELRAKTDILLIPSFTASSLDPDAWIPALRRLENEGADGIQLDFFYMGNIIGKDGLGHSILTLLKALREETDIPIMPKLNINLPKDFIIPLIAESGTEYVSLLDSVRSPYIKETDETYAVDDRLDPETTSCFGSWQLPLTLGYTYTAAKYGLKVCAGGGVCNADDVKKLLATGATTVQSATFITKNPQEIQRLIILD